jgi:hypothetical protein
MHIPAAQLTQARVQQRIQAELLLHCSLEIEEATQQGLVLRKHRGACTWRECGSAGVRE